MRRLLAIAAAALLWSIPSSACTAVIVSAEASATGRPLIWKQRDTSAGLNYLDHFEATPGTYAFTGMVNSDDRERESVWCGSNEAGFSIINTQSYGLSPLVTDDRPYEGMVMKKALEICRTVDEFEAYISSLAQPNGLEANFGVIDAEGGAAWFEVHDYGYTRFDVSDAAEGYIIRTNWSMTGREGEGKGYDRYDVATSMMAAHEGPFDAEWIIDVLGRQEIIARDKTVCSVVIEGPGKDDAKDSAVIWCAPGYTPCSYVIPAWVAAGDEIASPLRYRSANGRRGSSFNELARKLMKKYFLTSGHDTEKGRILSAVRNAESVEFAEGRKLDAEMKNRGAGSEAVRSFNASAAARFRAFRGKVSF